MQEPTASISMDRHEYTVPKVSIDGKSHGELLLVAIGSGATLAIIILIILTSLIRHKIKPASQMQKDKPSENFTLAKTQSDFGISSSSSQESNLMYKYFGKSLSSFDVERTSEMETSLSNPSSGCVVIDFVDLNIRHSFYRRSFINSTEKNSSVIDQTQGPYIQTIAC